MPKRVVLTRRMRSALAAAAGRNKVIAIDLVTFRALQRGGWIEESGRLTAQGEATASDARKAAVKANRLLEVEIAYAAHQASESN